MPFIPAPSGGGGGSGDVVGPASSVDNNLAQFDGLTGKLIEDSGIPNSDVVRKSQSNTFTAAPQILPASATGAAPIRLPHGTAPTSPVNGDVWTTTAGIFVRVNGVTLGPLTAATGDVVGPGSSTDNRLALFNSTSGKLIKESSLLVSDLAVLGANTFTGKQTTAASASGGSGLVLPHGTAPTSPNNGDIWTTTAGLYVRINGATVGPLAAAGGGGSPSRVQLATGTPAVTNAYTWTSISASYKRLYIYGTVIALGSADTYRLQWSQNNGSTWNYFDQTQELCTTAIGNASHSLYIEIENYSQYINDWMVMRSNAASTTAGHAAANVETGLGGTAVNALRLITATGSNFNAAGTLRLFGE